VNLDVVTADLIGDIALVVGASSLLGALARRVGQPTVVGQIAAGILLGPSLLGRLPGHLTHHLFTTQTIPFISVLAQVAVVIFMFGVGYEIDLKAMRARVRPVTSIAIGAMAIPLALGAGIALAMQHHLGFLGENSGDGRSFVLFFGVATSITALPVLAAIVRERGIAETAVGQIATTAAGAMDVSAWLILAAVLCTKVGGTRPWPETALLLVGFVAVLLLLVRPALTWWIRQPRAVVSSQVPLALVLATAGAWATAALGLHPIFGAFFAGLIMPKHQGEPDADVLRSMEQTGKLLLPLFFVVTGLTTNVGALNGDDVALLALILLCAIGGKGLGGYAMARLSGLDRQQSSMIGVLVNTRGLTELIALNVGLGAGIIDQQLFTVLVLMALITTAMTGPLITVLNRRYGALAVSGERAKVPAVPGA
jgi:Kef-type K+ transport system membrane component KefB